MKPQNNESMYEHMNIDFSIIVHFLAVSKGKPQKNVAKQGSKQNNTDFHW
jgi:hypothetical protein